MSETPLHQQVGAELYMRLGNAITQWAHVEDALLKVFWNLQDKPDFITTSAIFHTPFSDQVQIDMANNVAKIVLKNQPELLEEWEKLYNRLNKKLRKRNTLAHRTALHHATDPSKSELRSGLFDVNRTNLGHSKDGLTPKDIHRNL